MNHKRAQGGPVTVVCLQCKVDKVVIGKSKCRLKCRKCKSILK